MISVNVLMAGRCGCWCLQPRAWFRLFQHGPIFFRMVHNYIGQLDPYKKLPLISVLNNAVRPPLRKSKAILSRSNAGFALATRCFSGCFFHSSAVINSAAQFLTPYEQTKPDRHVLEMMDSVFAEVELSLLREWPSKSDCIEPAGDHLKVAAAVVSSRNQCNRLKRKGIST